MKFIILALCLLSFSCQKQESKVQNQFSDKMQQKIEDDIKRDDITGRMHVLFRSVDAQDWVNVKEILADQVDFDMGEGPSTKTSDEVVDVWKNATAGIDGSQHIVGNYGIEVNGNEAKLMFVGIATHYKKLKSRKNTRTFHGSYEITMKQPDGDSTNWAWKVTKFKYMNKFMDGNVTLK
jgi:hypothetical protein